MPYGRAKKDDFQQKFANLGGQGQVQPVTEDLPSTTHDQKDLLTLARLELTAPFHGLLVHYLTNSNVSKRTTANCLHIFKSEHKTAYKVVFVADALLKSIYLAIFIFVITRGLGLLDYITNLLK